MGCFLQPFWSYSVNELLQGGEKWIALFVQLSGVQGTPDNFESGSITS